jgi:hypothetical protein
VRGKTVTVRLGAKQAKLVQVWIANGRKLDRIIAHMEERSLLITERLLRHST